MVTHDLHISEKTTVLLTPPQVTLQTRLAHLFHVNALIQTYNNVFAPSTATELEPAAEPSIAEETSLAISVTELCYRNSSATFM